MANQNTDTVIIGSTVPPRPKNIIDAVSQIQQYYTLEKEGNPIPADFLTLEGALDLWGIGLRTAFKNSIISTLVTPFMIGVFYKYVPVFGQFNPGIYDKIWIIIANYSLTICYALFLTYITRYYIGQITKSSIKNLFSGIITGALISGVVVFVLFHTLYYFILTPNKVASTLLELKGFLNMDILERIYVFILNLRNVLIISSWAIVLNMIIMLSVPVGFMIFKARRLDKELKNRDKWQIGV